jgi:hypothetical protein
VSGSNRVLIFTEKGCQIHQSEAIGIHYSHPRSRVCRMTGWSGHSAPSTPVYSPLWNVFVGMAKKHGAGSRRPQSSRDSACIHGPPSRASPRGSYDCRSWRRARTQPQFDWIAGFPAAAFGLPVWSAMGVDFPRSNRGFARFV